MFDCSKVSDVRIPVWYSVPLDTYYPRKVDAILATERIISPDFPRYYPGGNVVLMTRGVPKTPTSEEEQPVSVPEWNLPNGLSEGWDANELYYSYEDIVYPTKEYAAGDNFFSWYVTSPGTPMFEYRRGIQLQELGSPARFILPILILIAILLLVQLITKIVSWYQRANTGKDLKASAILLTWLKLFAALKTVVIFLLIGSVVVTLAYLAITALNSGNLIGFSLYGAGLVISMLFTWSVNKNHQFLKSFTTGTAQKINQSKSK
jgi:hypothetical protein